jgi:hypothetical protein
MGEYSSSEKRQDRKRLRDYFKRKTLEANCHTLEDITEFCIEKLTQLDECTIWPDSHIYKGITKLLPLESYVDATVIATICEQIDETKERGDKMCVHSFGCGNNQRRKLDDSHECFPAGIEQWIYSGVTRVPAIPPGIDLEPEFEHVFHKLRTNWRRGTAQQVDTVFFKKDVRRWILYTKPEAKGEMRILAFVFPKLFVHSATLLQVAAEWWNADKSMYELRPTIYLWIRKCFLRQFKKAVSFELTVTGEQ